MIFRLLLLSLCVVPAVASDLGEEVARKHAERSGGAARALQSLYAEGRTLVGEEVVEFKMWAERPNRLRIESTSPKRKVVQIFDGTHEPVLQHSDVEGGRPLRMSPAERGDFIANADFDGPLMNHAAKGYDVDFAGVEPVAGRPATKLLLMHPAEDVMFVWVDRETAEIVKRSVFRTMRGRRVAVDTLFGDFRRVGATLQPHRVESKVGDQTLFLMLISKMAGDAAEVTADKFAVPENWPMLPQEFRARALKSLPNQSQNR